MQNPKAAADRMMAAPVVEEAQRKVLIDAKQRVETVLEFIEDLEKIQGVNKKSKQAKEVMKKFLKCNISNPAIFRKYNDVMTVMEKISLLGGDNGGNEA